MSYNDKLDADEQITAEEAIAAHLYQSAYSMPKDQAAELGRNILLLVLRKFRPDLIEGDDVVNLEQPADLSEKGAKAHRVLVQYLKLKGLTDTGGGKAFRSPKEWAERGETYGKDSHLIVVYDGGDHRQAFTLDGTAYDTVEAMQQQLATVGCFFEECTTWYGAVYSL